jgi:hypothetical protein
MRTVPIKSFEVVSIDAKRFSKMGERPPQLRVEQNATVTNIATTSVKDAQIDFRFIVSYANMGMINVDGRIMWEGDPSPIVEQWSKTKKLPNDIAGMVLGAIFSNCLPIAVVVSRDIALPPPIPPPQIQMPKETRPPGAKDHKSSMEVA